MEVKDKAIINFIQILKLNYQHDFSTQQVLLLTAPLVEDSLRVEIETTLQQICIGVPLLESLEFWQKRNNNQSLKPLLDLLCKIVIEDTKTDSTFDPVQELNFLLPREEKVDDGEVGEERIPSLLKTMALSNLGVLINGIASEHEVIAIQNKFQILCKLKPLNINQELAEKYPLILSVTRLTDGSQVIGNVKEIVGFRLGRPIYQDIYSFHSDTCLSYKLIPSLNEKLSAKGHFVSFSLFSPTRFQPTRI